jgi:hypothetical protein
LTDGRRARQRGAAISPRGTAAHLRASNACARPPHTRSLCADAHAAAAAPQRYFAQHEFGPDTALLCCSDCTPLPLRELLSLADAESLALWEALALGYSESQGLPALREEVARCVFSQRARGARSTRGTDCAKHALRRSLYGGGVRADDVVCCVPQEGVLLAHALLAPGDHVVVTAPGYQSLHSLASTLRCEVSPWLPARSDAGVLHFDVEDLKRLVRPGAQATTPVCCGVLLSWRLTLRLQARRRSSS